MLFNSIEFMVFFPSVCILYYLIPSRAKNLFLLACSYFFYMCWNPKYALILLISTAITYYCGLLLGRSDGIEDEEKRIRNKKLCIASAFILNLGILFFFKYFNLFSRTLNSVFALLHIHVNVPFFDVLLPAGISFYTFKVLSYIMDVYRKDIPAETDFIRYALYVSFFPQLAQGPIAHAKDMLPQFSEEHVFDWYNIRRGLLLMLYGYFQKAVLASWLGMIVDTVYGNWANCSGLQLLIATVCFAFQLYSDFAGYSCIAIGAGEVMGFTTLDNFNVPYLSKSVSEFWRRWHISLSTWFRDYLYIPLGGNRKGKWIKYFNIMTVFLVSGLWHGAEYHYIAWGGLNGLFQIIGDLLRPLRTRTLQLLHIQKNSAVHNIFRVIFTFILILITWVFFRAPSLVESVYILEKILIGFGTSAWRALPDGLKGLGIDRPVLMLLVASMIILIFFDVMKYRNICVRDFILKQKPYVRWTLYYAAVTAILVFGVYGPGYSSTEFMYIQF